MLKEYKYKIKPLQLECTPILSKWDAESEAWGVQTQVQEAQLEMFALRFTEAPWSAAFINHDDFLQGGWDLRGAPFGLRRREVGVEKRIDAFSLYKDSRAVRRPPPQPPNAGASKVRQHSSLQLPAE